MKMMDIDDDLTMVDFLKKASMSTAQEDTSLPGGELLPNHPRTHGSLPKNVRQLSSLSTMMKYHGKNFFGHHKYLS
jgi:hypothetical protein